MPAEQCKTTALMWKAIRKIRRSWLVILVSLFVASCATQQLGEFHQKGMASWYGPHFQKHKTASGERFDMHKLTAAHRTLPFGSIVRVRSLATSREVSVRINDRGPFAKDRIIDLSYAAAKKLGILDKGEEEVEIVLVPDATLALAQ